MNISGKHFYTTTDFSQDEILHLVDLALRLKQDKFKKNLYGKSLCLLFFNPSLRTRVSFTVAMGKLGGLAIDIPIKDGVYTFEFTEGVVMDKETIEHVKEAARVLSRYCEAIAIRSSQLITTAKKSIAVESWEEMKKDKIIKAFMRYSEVPIINMESNVYHPCQGLGDAVTLCEKLGTTKNKKYVLTWVYHPKALPMATPNSQALTACDLGMDIVVAYPPGWELDKKIIQTMKQRSVNAGGSFEVGNNMEEALIEADIVCAKSWGAIKFYGKWKEEKKIREKLKNWSVDQKRMILTNNALFMHCLPIRRNVEVADQVLDSRNSIIYDQAENRMWAQMAILAEIIGGKT